MLHSDLPFLPERMKINKSTQLVCSTQNKENCNTRKSFKAGTKSWIKISKGT